MPVGAIPAVVATVASLAGTAASVAGAQQSKRNMNNVLTQNLNQQNALQKQAQPIVANAISKSGAGAAQQSLGSGIAQATKNYEQTQGTQLSNVQNPVHSLSTGSISNDPFVKGQNTLGNQQAAQLQGWNQFQTDQAINDLVARGQLSTVAAQSQNAASTLPLQLQGAQNSGESLYAIGQLGQTLGSTLGAYNATKPKTSTSPYSNYSRGSTTNIDLIG